MSGREVITSERGALRLPTVERHQREAVAERRQINPVGIQHFGAPGVGAKAEDLVVQVQRQAVARFQLVDVLGLVQPLGAVRPW